MIEAPSYTCLLFHEKRALFEGGTCQFHGQPNFFDLNPQDTFLVLDVFLKLRARINTKSCNT